MLRYYAVNLSRNVNFNIRPWLYIRKGGGGGDPFFGRPSALFGFFKGVVQV